MSSRRARRVKRAEKKRIKANIIRRNEGKALQEAADRERMQQAQEAEMLRAQRETAFQLINERKQNDRQNP